MNGEPLHGALFLSPVLAPGEKTCDFFYRNDTKDFQCSFSTVLLLWSETQERTASSLVADTDEKYNGTEWMVFGRAFCDKCGIFLSSKTLIWMLNYLMVVDGDPVTLDVV